MRAAFTTEVQAIEADMQDQLADASRTLTRLTPLIAQPSARGAEALARTGRALRARGREADLRIVTLSATQAPVACDLRLVLTLMQIVQRQGLIANQLMLIAEQLAEIDPTVIDRCGTTDKLTELARLACAQVERAAGAFITRDPVACDRVCLGDDRLDQLNRQVCRTTLEMRLGPAQRELAFRHVLIARSLERIGDNAVDIARRTGELVKADVHHLSHPSAPALAAFG